MAAPIGNQFYKNVDPTKAGRPKKFKNPAELWKQCVKYFEQCDNNPIITHETTKGPKGNYEKEVKHRIPYTWQGLYVFLGVCNLDHYKNNDDFSGILNIISNVIYDQKLSGAAAGVFNANIIYRDLGLADHKSVDLNDQRKKVDELFPMDDEIEGEEG